MVALRTSLAALFLVLGACDVGEVPPGGGSGGAPDAGGGGGGDIVATEAKFTANVKPLAMARGCILAGCHGGGILPNFTSFQTISAGPSTDPTRYVKKPGAASILVTKAAAGATTHSNVAYFSTTEMDTIISWIENK